MSTSNTLPPNIKQRNKVVSEFNTHIFELLNLLKMKDPNSPVDRIMNLIKIAKRADHESIITSSGPYFLKYRNQIESQDEKFFTADIIIAEVERTEMNSNVPQERNRSRELAMGMFDSINDIINVRQLLSSSERNIIYSKAHSLIDLYLDFCVCCKYQKKK